MKTIRMITLAAGPQGVLQPGKVYQVDDALADALVADRHAVLAPKGAPMGPPPLGAVEMAAVEPPERAVRTRPRPRQAKE